MESICVIHTHAYKTGTLYFCAIMYNLKKTVIVNSDQKQTDDVTFIFNYKNTDKYSFVSL